MGKNILLVDEDKQFTRLVSSVLEGRGHTVLQADSEHPKESMARSGLDLIILSSPLKGEDIQWLSRIREANNSAKVILVAQNQEHLDAIKSKVTASHSVSLMVHKPIIPYIFGAQVDHQFDENQSDAAKQKMKDFETMFLALVAKYARVLPTRISELSQAIEQA